MYLLIFCSEKERQQWLIALGSAKANQANRQRRQRISSTTSSSFGDSPNQAIPQLNRSSSTNSIGKEQYYVPIQLFLNSPLLEPHSLIRGVLIQSCSAGAKNSPIMYFFIHNSVVLSKILKIVVPKGQNFENLTFDSIKLFILIIIDIEKQESKWHNDFQYFG